MAERRMFSKQIVESDAFTDMSLSAQALYFHLGMIADDDGFVNCSKRVQQMLGAKESDLKELTENNFLIQFESKVSLIKHWKINNYIQKDRYHPTKYTDEMAMVSVKPNDAYTLIRKPKVKKEEEAEKVEEPKEPPVITMILNDKSEYGVIQAKIDSWKELYPSVDIMQELRKMKGWCESNPTKRKTKGGIERFINGWLSKEQDKHHTDRKDDVKGWYE